MPTPRRKPEVGVGLGPATVPYSRTNGDNTMLDPSAQQQATQFLASRQSGGAPQGDDLFEEDGQAPPPATTPPPGAPDSGQLTDQALQGMQGGAPQGPSQDPQISAVIAALDNPNTPPEMKQRIEMMLSMSARRRLAGINS